MLLGGREVCVEDSDQVAAARSEVVSSPDVTPTSGSKNLAWVPRQSDPNTEARDLDYNVWCFSLGRGGVRVGPVRGGAKNQRELR